MSDPRPDCPACRVSMERGFVVDFTHHRSAPRAAEWIEGAPEKRFWTGLKLADRQRLPIQAYRCPRCGMLTQYALPERSES